VEAKTSFEIDQMDEKFQTTQLLQKLRQDVKITWKQKLLFEIDEVDEKVNWKKEGF